MSDQTIIILRSICFLPALAGVGLLVMGLGLLPLDDNLVQIAKACIGDAIPLSPFLIVLGTTKILSALGLWNIGPFPPHVSFLGFLVPALSACYGHYKVEGALGAIVPLGYSMVLTFYHHLAQQQREKGKKS